MEFKEYMKLAMRTNPEGKDFKDNILNGLLGLYGELIEYSSSDSVNGVEELGDAYWYLALLCDTMDIVPEGVSTNNHILLYVASLSEHFKKHFFQGHDLGVAYVSTLLSSIKAELDCIASHISSPEEVMRLNIDKLKKRFPNGFEVEKSINRDV